MKIKIIPCLKDNYSYLLIDDINNTSCIIDPSEADPIAEILDKNDLKLDFILNTHHHYDHVGGNKKLKEKYGAKVVGYIDDAERIPDIDIMVKDGEIWSENNFKAKITHIPGHTLGHICFHFFNEKIVFTGDTLFSLGCGRVFEGSHKDMFNSLLKLKSLPPVTKIYFGHEYTLNNSIFCSKFDEDNSKLDRKIIDIKKKLNNGLPTVPSSIKDELDCNIFLRAKNLKEFSKLRDLKDNF